MISIVRVIGFILSIFSITKSLYHLYHVKCHALSLQKYRESSYMDALDVYLGVAAIFYLLERSFRWSIMYLFIVSQLLQGILKSAQLFCLNYNPNFIAPAIW